MATIVSPAQDDAALSTAVTTLNCLEIRSVTWDRVCTATASDRDMRELHELIENDIHEPTTRCEMPSSQEHLHDFFTILPLMMTFCTRIAKLFLLFFEM